MSKKEMGSRDFLKSTAAGLGGFVYLGANAKISRRKTRKRRRENYLPNPGKDRDKTSGHYHGGHEYQQPGSGSGRLE